MSELLQAAKAVIEHWNEFGAFKVKNHIPALRAAVERAERQGVVGFEEWWEHDGCGMYWDAHSAWIAAQQAERERIRARAKIAAERTWRAGDWYIGPQHNMIGQFVDALLEDDDAPAA